MRILLIGSTSFASEGLESLLRASGNDVWTLDRRPKHPHGLRVLRGSVAEPEKWVDQVGSVDVVINFALLKGGTIEDNMEYCKQLLEAAGRLSATRLVHISSVSVVQPGREPITEDTPVDESFAGKGAYAAVKAASEWWLAGRDSAIERILIRPGFILGMGMVNPVIGMGKAVPGNLLLCMGRGSVRVPIVARATVQEAVARACSMPVAGPVTRVMVTAPNPPDRREYLRFACTQLGMARRPLILPGAIWQMLLLALSCMLSLKSGRWNNLVRKFSASLQVREFDSTGSAAALGMEFKCDWCRELRESFPRHVVPTRLPEPLVVRQTSRSVESILFIGAGRIVQEEHWPALRRIGFRGTVEWFDPFAGASSGQARLNLKRLHDLKETLASVAVVATPVPVRRGLLEQLPHSVGRVLLEKPWALSAQGAEHMVSALEDREVYVMHNYRYKPNVQAALRYTRSHNPGEFVCCRLHFDSPPVYDAGPAWMRDERGSRTLLMDYGIHFLDLCILPAADPQLQRASFEVDPRHGTQWISADFACGQASAAVFLRQGFHQRRCLIEWVFANYTVRIGFFPETFQVLHGRYSGMDDLAAACGNFRATSSKIVSKLTKSRWHASSHALVLAELLSSGMPEGLEPLSLQHLRKTYSAAFALAEKVYS